MFDSNSINVTPIPERVLEYCRLAAVKDYTQEELKQMIEPPGLNKSGTSYFSNIRDTAQELHLTENIGKAIHYCGSKDAIISFDSFRRYCNSIVWEDHTSRFYKVSKCFLNANNRWLPHNTLTAIPILDEVRENVGETVQAPDLLGTRFWLSFLGFGYIYEEGNTMNFLPNMYIALKDFAVLGNAEADKTYTMREFLKLIGINSMVALEDSMKTRMCNLALSNGLRQMHDSKEIELQSHLDSEEVWELFKNDSHSFTSKVTHVVYKGVKK